VRFGWPVACLVFAALLPALAGGCAAMHRYRPLAVLVRDAETKQPIASAEVRIAYPFANSMFVPTISTAGTGADGLAHLQAAPFGDGLTLETAARGYLPESRDVAVATIEHLEPAHMFAVADRRSADLVVEMYSEPAFTVELVVPSAFRGLITADVQIEDAMAAPRGQRCFRYNVAFLGEVQVKGPALLRRVFPPTFRARYADGKELDGEMSVTRVGFRWLKQEGNKHYFVVGTQPEYDNFRRDMAAESPRSEGRAQESSKAGQGGGRHRRGTDAE
jgi:hypothetical protein